MQRSADISSVLTLWLTYPPVPHASIGIVTLVFDAMAKDFLGAEGSVIRIIDMAGNRHSAAASDDVVCGHVHSNQPRQKLPAQGMPRFHDVALGHDPQNRFCSSLKWTTAVLGMYEFSLVNLGHAYVRGGRTNIANIARKIKSLCASFIHAPV